jgi:hypothetical protein
MRVRVRVGVAGAGGGGGWGWRLGATSEASDSSERSEEDQEEDQAVTAQQQAEQVRDGPCPGKAQQVAKRKRKSNMSSTKKQKLNKAVTQARWQSHEGDH